MLPSPLIQWQWGRGEGESNLRPEELPLFIVHLWGPIPDEMSNVQ